MVTLKMTVTPYVAEYIRAKYYDRDAGCVRFPPRSDIYHLLYDLMSRRPAGVPPEREGNLVISLPSRREAHHAMGKAPEQYNYLSSAAIHTIDRKMRLMFWAEVHDTMDEQKHLHGRTYKDTAWDILRRYDIQSIGDDAILKNYQRWRLKQRPRATRPWNPRKKS